MTPTKTIALGLVLSAGLMGTPAQGHRSDLIAAGRRAGPIVLGETTVRQARRWFGEPTQRKVVEVGCIRAVRLRWARRLQVFAPRYRGETEAIAEARVKRRTIDAGPKGEITVHTRRGLRVGDTEGKLRRLYPGARPETHRGHTHYSLASGFDGRLLAKVVRGRVTAMLTGPYEFC